MSKRINTVDEVIDTLGGTGAVARMLGVDDRLVSNWRRPDRGLPAYTYVALIKALEAKGFSAPSTLWRMWEPVQT